MQTHIKCSIMLRFIWVFTVCQSTLLRGSDQVRLCVGSVILNLGCYSDTFRFNLIRRMFGRRYHLNNSKMVPVTAIPDWNSSNSEKF